MLWSGLRNIYQWELKFYKADQNKRCFKQKITNNKHTNVAKQNFWKLVANECNWENGPLFSYLLGLSQKVNCSTYCWWFRNPASPSWYGKYPILYDGFPKHPNGGFFEISEPSTVGYFWFVFLSPGPIVFPILFLSLTTGTSITGTSKEGVAAWKQRRCAGRHFSIPYTGYIIYIIYILETE